MNKKIDKREIILSVAQKKFARYGLQKTTIDEIAKDARISKGLIYHYFTNKEDIFYAVIKKETEIFESFIREKVNKEKIPAKKLKVFIKTRMNYMLESINLNELNREIAEIIMPEVEKGLIDYRKREIDLVASIIEEGIQHGDFKKIDSHKAAISFLSLFRSLEIPWIIDKNFFDVNKIVDFSLNIFFEGINIRT